MFFDFFLSFNIQYFNVNRKLKEAYMSENSNYDPEYVKQLFNRMSGSYERVNYITSFGFSLRWRKQFLKQIPQSNEGVKILDLMTGMGETWDAINKRFPNAKFEALDFSEGMLKYAEAKNKARFNNRVILHYQNVLQNNLPENHYDIVISAFGLKTFNNEQLKQLAYQTQRLLKPGGHFSFIEVSKPSGKILSFFYRLYLKHSIPLLGKLLLGNPSEYRMLWKYTSSFGNSDNVVRIFTEVGLTTERRKYFGDCASGISGRKAHS